jgi:hypothetical protein
MTEQPHLPQSIEDLLSFGYYETLLDYQSTEQAPYNEFFLSLLNNAEMAQPRNEVVNKLNNDLILIKNLFHPLLALGIKVELSLVGGAVRDFYTLDPSKIKDLDILVTIPSWSFENQIKQMTNQSLTKFFFSQQLENVEWKDEESPEFKAYRLIQLCLVDKIGIEKSYSPRIANVETMLEHDNYTMWEIEVLNGVIKLKDEKLNYPCDILISKLPNQTFISRFDFEICKAGFDLSKLTKNWDVVDYAKFFFSCPAFFKDCQNKTLTTVLDNRSQGGIEKSMQYHLPRLQKKYPDYKLIQEIKYAVGEEKEKLEKIRLNYSLNNKLSEKPEPKRKMKI